MLASWDQFVLSGAPEVGCALFKNSPPFMKSFCPAGAPLPLPMQTLTLCGFERSRPALSVQQSSPPFSLAINASFPSLQSKRPYESETYDSESAAIEREKPHSFEFMQSQLHGPSSDGESSSSIVVAKENRQQRINLLQLENEDLHKRIRSSDEELQRLREVINQLFEVEKSQKRSKDDSKPQRRYWNSDEHERFLQALQRYAPIALIFSVAVPDTRRQIWTKGRESHRQLRRLAQLDTGGHRTHTATLAS